LAVIYNLKRNEDGKLEEIEVERTTKIEGENNDKKEPSCINM